MMNMLITIDGPSGVGKTTLGTLLAQDFNSNFFSSGKLYRTIAAFLITNPESSIEDLSLVIDENLNIDLNGFIYQDSQLYSKDINSKSSEIAKEKNVRNKISESLKLLNSKLTNGLIIEGRDMGSIVFPNADLKIYLDASLEVRAKRRLEQSNESETFEDLQKRDANDMNRAESPLIIPDGALYIDNTDIDMSDVVKVVKENLMLQ
tara:strand:- start:857 stop:1474 length:618 start_codon:yes stop_codon:yes gene_type:complete